jgi:hypothetical protein
MLPVINDPSPNETWANWGASQWDLYFLDSNGTYITDFNISVWNYTTVYNQIINMMPE